MNLKEQISKMKEKYGVMVVETEDGIVELKPSVEFYEKFIVHISIGNKETLVKFLLDELKKMVMKDCNLSEEDARVFVITYLEDILTTLESKLEKKQKRQMKN